MSVRTHRSFFYPLWFGSLEKGAQLTPVPLNVIPKGSVIHGQALAFAWTGTSVLHSKCKLSF